MNNLNIIILRIGVVGCVAMFLGCGGGAKNGPIQYDTKDLSGIYRTFEDEDIPSVTSLVIKEGRSKEGLNVRIYRNGFSVEEYAYFNQKELVQWADDRMGRELFLDSDKSKEAVRNFYEKELSILEVCGDKISYNKESLDFRHCLKLDIKDEDITAQGVLTLEVYELGSLIETVETSFTMVTKDRWFVDYMGHWDGEIQKSNASFRTGTGNNIKILFLPVLEDKYILRPDDINQVITYGSERFILFPNTRPMSELEESANPYLNLVYVSEDDGSRTIEFKSYVKSADSLEGNIYMYKNGQTIEQLGYYTLTRIY